MITSTTDRKATAMPINMIKTTPAPTQSLDELRALAMRWDGFSVNLNRAGNHRRPFLVASGPANRDLDEMIGYHLDEFEV